MHRQISNSAHCRLGKFFFWQFEVDCSRGQSFTLESKKEQQGSTQEGEGRELKRRYRKTRAEHFCARLHLFGHLCHRACFCLSLPLARGLLKDYHDHALVLYPQPPAQVGKCESTWGASTVCEHCTGRPSHPRDRAWVTEWDLSS